MRALVIALLILGSCQMRAQELFVVTEPASNAPAGSLGFKLGESLMKEKYKAGYNYHMMPEITWGVSKSLMLRASGFISNRNSTSSDLKTEGGSLYAKYRFVSTDDLHSHFRMAAFGRYSFNNADIHQEEIETMGHNSGFEVGIVATQLIKKVAISTSLSVEKALDNEPDNPFPNSQSNRAFNYTLSVGKLMYPRYYSDFKQTNINLMLELVGQTLNENQRSFLDVVPSVQFIINSQARIDLAYKQQLYSSMLRSAPNGIYLNLQYTFFTFKKNK
ncbi:hypothetical protein EZL74_03860 [Flavobacterium silvisoli]|uniref:DUF3078 domain-containing protein n=1 Tax=Flavobacterium silvisoli TaxID=2529433 RepID=A0A4Q9Z889_9FLAO|nr:hypothetical protein [Flavobacterium silvisoli]TBX70319.1 hypothetical protein EZL74_03860 [Flavobacterium silvisoli]